MNQEEFRKGLNAKHPPQLTEDGIVVFPATHWFWHPDQFRETFGEAEYAALLARPRLPAKLDADGEFL